VRQAAATTRHRPTPHELLDRLPLRGGEGNNAAEWPTRPTRNMAMYVRLGRNMPMPCEIERIAAEIARAESRLQELLNVAPG